MACCWLIPSWNRFPLLKMTVNVNILTAYLLHVLQMCCAFQPDLKIVSSAPRSLKRFCRWQFQKNNQDDSHPDHYDTALLLTRYGTLDLPWWRDNSRNDSYFLFHGVPLPAPTHCWYTSARSVTPAQLILSSTMCHFVSYLLRIHLVLKGSRMGYNYLYVI